MKIYALINGNTVYNIIETDDNGWPEGVDITEIEPRPGIGWHYSEDAGFIEPANDTLTQTESVPEPRIITNLAFDLRFTMAERIAIEIASIDNPSTQMEQRAMAAALRVSQERSRKAQFTDLDDPVTREGVEQMETLGLLNEGRAAEILDTSIQPGERPGDAPKINANAAEESA